MSKQKKKLMIIDGNALVHRSFHALPPSLTTKDGTLVNAVYGFVSFLIKAMKEMKPEYVVLTLDKKGPTFRHKRFKEYKAKRVKAPDELYAQIPMVKKLAIDFNIPVFEKDGFEADDLIGTIAQDVDGKVEKIIVTGDKDTLQLVNEHTKVYSMSRGLSDAILYDMNLVKEKMGVRVDQVIDYKALRGDPSDNIPGVPGIGDKMAIILLDKFKSLDKLYEYVDKNSIQKEEKIKPRIFELLKEYKKLAFLSYELATIRCDVPMDFDLEQARFADLDKERIVKALTKLEFKSLLPRIQEIFNGATLDTKEKRINAAEDKLKRNENNFKYILVDNKAKFKKFFSELKKQKAFTFDTETSSLNPIISDLLGISFSWKKGYAHYVLVESRKVKAQSGGCRDESEKSQGSLFGGESDIQSVGREDWLKKMEVIFGDEKIKKRAHNAKFDNRVLRAHGIEVRGLDFDTMIASYLLSPGTRGHGLDALTFSELGFEKISSNDLLGTGKDKKTFSEVSAERMSLYSCEDSDFTNRLIAPLKKRLKKENLFKLFLDMELPLVNVLSSMEDMGIKIDPKFLSKMSGKMNKKIKTLEKKIIDLAGEEFNIRSTKQLKYILFEKLEISTNGIKKTKTGFSTGADELEKLRDLHPIIILIQEHRELAKLVSTYIDALPELINKDTGRVHTSFNQTVTATGRLSSTNPNLQNIPARTEMGREIRKAFIAEKGNKLLALDYSQIELRLAAHMSGDKKMIKAFKNGADIHRATAAEINGVSLSEVSSKMRREAKAINFGVLYGQGPHGLARTADIPYLQAREFIDNYFKVYTGVQKYVDKKIKEAREKGYVETLFGRKRFLLEINSSVVMVRKGAERMAVNTPLQGTAADMIKMAMIQVSEQVKDKDVKMLLQVHDELIFEVSEKKVEEYAQKIKEIMEGVINLGVPVIVDVKIGDNWGEL
jgi:DNA polymerase-1